MTRSELVKLVQDIVIQARRLTATHTDQGHSPVNYACIFTQSQAEYDEMLGLAQQMGTTIETTAMGPVFEITPIQTEAGKLGILKIRRPDPKRPERGDADFTVSDYSTFKKSYLGKPGFGLIERPDMEMIELIDPTFKVLAYYSHPILADVIKYRREKSKAQSQS